MPVMSLLLASASPARAGLLRAAGVQPHIQPADIDEDAVLAASHAGGHPPPAREAVAVLARAKAEHVAESGPSADLILGCDSLLELDGETLGKPGTADVARERWRRMRGRTGVLHTGHWLIRTAQTARPAAAAAHHRVSTEPLAATAGAVAAGAVAAGAVSSTTVTFADITDVELEAYLATGEPLAVAGGFTIDGRGGAFVRRIEGDHHTVVGLSLVTLRALLTEVGCRWIDLWA